MSHKEICIGSAKKLVIILGIVVISLCLSVTGIRAEKAIDHEAERAEAVKRLRRGFEDFEESIDISDLSVSPNELGRIFSDATKDTPYLFYVSNNLAYSYRTGGCVIAVKPRYTMEKEDARSALKFCRSEILKMTLLVCDRETDLDRLLGAHDLICKRFEYDVSLESNNIYTFLKTGKGTCQGYTWTYMAILRELGIECRYVASDTISHIWLAVKIDGEWYHSDATWDDPGGRENLENYSRRHLLFSDDKADRDGYADRYSALDIRCESTLYDGNDILSAIPFCAFSGDADHDGKISLRDLLLMRLHREKREISGRNICGICADADGNLSFDEDDVQYVRRLLLEQ